MRYGRLTVLTCILLGFDSQAASAASRQQQIVTRVDDVRVAQKGHNLVIQALGMGRTPSAMGRAGYLVRRGGNALNKEGLLEYNLMFNGVPNYTGFKLKPVKGKLKEHQVPVGVRGVRIFGEFNQMDALLPEPKPKQRRSLNPFHKKQQPHDASETVGSIAEPTPH